MARPRKNAEEANTNVFEKPADWDYASLQVVPEGFAAVLRRVDTGDQIEQAAKHLLRKAAEGDDWAISLVADLLRSDQ